MLQNNISNLRLFDDKYPLKRNTWPQSRTRKDYEDLLTPHQPRATNESQGVTFSLPEGAVIFDAGMGDGNALAEFKREDTRTIGVTLHEYKQSNEDKLDTICCSPIPHGDNAKKIFSAFRGKVHQVFDIYGPCTYAENPIFALIYLGLLLAPNGQANIIVSQIKHEDIDQSPLGDAITRQKIRDFFRTYLSLELTMCRTKIDSSLVIGDFCYDFLMRIQCLENASANPTSLETLFQFATEHIGTPKQIPKSTEWGIFKGNHVIQGKSYQDTFSEWKSKVSQVIAKFNVENHEITINISFENQQALKLFALIFSEFYIYQPKPNWKMSVDEKTASLIYTSPFIKKGESSDCCWQEAYQDLEILNTPQIDPLNDNGIEL